MSKLWVKLWYDFLHDRKLRELPEFEQLRFVKLLLIAGELDMNGQLPPVETIAYDFGIMTKDALSKVDSTLTRLQQVGVVGKNSEGWFIVNWNKRQSPADPTAAERQRRHRERDKQRDITRILPASTSSSVSESLTNKKDLEISAIPFGDNHARDCLKLYTLVTNQPQPPSAEVERVIADLSPILDHYQSVEAAVPDGKKVFARWCSTPRKNGGSYRVTNVNWLGWWLEEIAPRPDAQPQSFRERLAKDLGVEL